MSNWKPAAIAAVVAGAVGLGAGVVIAGDDGDGPPQTAVVTETVQAPTPTPTPNGGAQPPEEGAAQGAVADGRYAMEYEDYKGFNYADTYTGKESVWDATTECTAGACTLEMRRELDPGYKTYTIEQSPDDPLVWEGVATTTLDCNEDGELQTEERLSLRLTASDQIDGRETATAMDVYLRPQSTCNRPRARGEVVSEWRGVRVDG